MRFFSSSLFPDAVGSASHSKPATHKSFSQETHQTGDDSSDVEEHALDFPWSLVTTCTDILGIDQNEPHWIRNAIASPRLRLILWVFIFLLSRSVRCTDNSGQSLAWLSGKSTKVWIDIVFFRSTFEQSVETTEFHLSKFSCVFAVSDILTLFWVVWFSTGHVTTCSSHSYQHNYCRSIVREMKPVMFIVHYVMGVCSLIGFLFDSPTVLKWCQKQIQFRWDYLSEERLRREKLHKKKSQKHIGKDTLPRI